MAKADKITSFDIIYAYEVLSKNEYNEPKYLECGELGASQTTPLHSKFL